ncbi:MAG: hypothetical protein ABSG63_15785 [Spirochaetia bacterium]
MIARPARTLLVCLLLALAVASTLGAQDHVPVPYTPGEFAPWMRDVWRAEVIAVGSFPFTLFLTLEVYDSWRYSTNGFNPSYAPWPIGSGAGTTYSPQETAWLAVSAVSVSVLIAGLDYLLGRLSESAAHR